MSETEEISPEHYFFARNQVVIKDLSELKAALEQMDDGAFSHHVSEGKNDFSEWVRNIIKDKKLAADISNLTSKEDIVKSIEKRIEEAEKKEETLGSIEKEIEKVQKKEGDTKKSPMKEEERIAEIPLKKIEEILQREKEIEKKEEKIREIEDKIEEQLKEMKKPENKKFFTKEFIQGIITGALISIIGILIYIKFFG